MKPYLIAELVCLCTGLLFIDRSRPSYIKALICLVALTFINEFLLVPYIKIHHPLYRNYLYSGFSVMDMLVWLCIFYQLLTERKQRILFWLLAVSCIAGNAFELSNAIGWQTLHPDSFRFYEMSMIIFSVVYLFEMLKREYYSVFKDVNCWLCFACIAFHSIMFLNITTMAQNNYWRLSNAANVFHILMNAANIIYYGLLSIAFIISGKQWKDQRS